MVEQIGKTEIIQISFYYLIIYSEINKQSKILCDAFLS